MLTMKLNALHLHLTSAVENQTKKTFIMFYVESISNNLLIYIM